MADTGGSASPKRMWCSVPERLRPHLAMLALQFGTAGIHVVARAALNMGISKLVFLVYRNIIVLHLLLFFAYFGDMNWRPPIPILLWLFLLATVGITANQGFYLLGLENTSPTFASAMQNCVPGIGYLMGALLRRERSRLDRKDRKAMVLGSICCVAGAVITLYNCPVIHSPAPPLHKSTPMFVSLGDAKGKNWTLGCVYLIGHCLSWSSWPVLQKEVLERNRYNDLLSVHFYTCFFGLIQFLILAAFFEREPQAWTFHSGGQLLPILYAGVVAVIVASVTPTVLRWYVDRGGRYEEVFENAYKPVQTLVVVVIMSSIAFMSSISLSFEEFYSGGIIGAALIIIGLCLFLWGKRKETSFYELLPNGNQREMFALQNPYF